MAEIGGAVVVRLGPASGVAEVDPVRPAATDFSVIVRDHADQLYGFCIRLSGDATEAEDLLQETLIRALRAWPDVREPSRAKSWLFAIAMNAWRDHLRARDRRVRTASLDEVDEDEPDLSRSSPSGSPSAPSTRSSGSPFWRSFGSASLRSGGTGSQRASSCGAESRARVSASRAGHRRPSVGRYGQPSGARWHHGPDGEGCGILHQSRPKYWEFRSEES